MRIPFNYPIEVVSTYTQCARQNSGSFCILLLRISVEMTALSIEKTTKTAAISIQNAQYGGISPLLTETTGPLRGVLN